MNMATNRQGAHLRPSIPLPSSGAQVVTTNSLTLERIRNLLDTGRVEKAMHLASRLESDLDRLNTIGVCQMRLRNTEKAVSLYRSLVLASGGVSLRSDVPDRIKVNYATALLLSGNVTGCLSILDELHERETPAAQRLRTAIQRWKRTLPFWHRLKLALGANISHPVELDFEPGEV